MLNQLIDLKKSNLFCRVHLQHLVLFLSFLGTFQLQSQNRENYIVYNNGDTLRAKIAKVKPTKVRLIINNRMVWLPANQLRAVKRDLYEYESFYFEKKGKFKLLVKNYSGELIVFSEFSTTNTSVRGGSMGTMILFGAGGVMVANGGNTRSAVNLSYLKPYFRHMNEDRKVIHLASIGALKNNKYLICPEIMNELIKGIGEFDLDRQLVNGTFRDLMLKYNNNCAAKLREAEYEK